VPASGEHAWRRYLGRWVNRLQVASEAPGDGEPGCPVIRSGAFRQARPGDGQLAGDRGRPGRLQVGDKLREQPPVALQLEAQRPAQAQVVVDLGLQRAHCSPPGQGAASWRSRSRSTRAYTAVLWRL
jgi:hypothetical protein